MRIKQARYEETTWGKLKDIAMSGEAEKVLGLCDEIEIELESGEKATVTVAAFLPETEDRPAGIRFMFKDALEEMSKMNERATNEGGYKMSDGRRHILEKAYPSLPADLRAVIRNRRITEIVRGETMEYEDPLWLPSETDMFGREEESWQNGRADGPDDFQLPIYKTERDRVKMVKGIGTAPYWVRSVRASGSYSFCLVNTGGSAGSDYAYCSYGMAPGFDI